jgi:hypothetical protein
MCGKPAAFRQAAQPKCFSVEPGGRKGRAFPHIRRQSRDFFTPSERAGWGPLSNAGLRLRRTFSSSSSWQNGSFVPRFVSSRSLVFNEIGRFVPLKKYGWLFTGSHSGQAQLASFGVRRLATAFAPASLLAASLPVIPAHGLIPCDGAAGISALNEARASALVWFFPRAAPWRRGVPIRDRLIIFSLPLCFLKHSGFRLTTTRGAAPSGIPHRGTRAVEQQMPNRFTQ